MDGPNVNWKFLTLMHQKLNTEFYIYLINIISCGLYNIYNSLKSGVARLSWNVGEFLPLCITVLRTLLLEGKRLSRSFRLHIAATEICSHRWLENVPVIEEQY